MRSDHSRPQQASVTPINSSHPPKPPDSRKRERPGTDQLAQTDAEHRQPGQHGRRRAGTRHAGVDPRREPFPLNDIALRGAHQRGDGQSMRLGQLPTHREPLPVRRQRRARRDAAQTRRHVGAQPCPRGHRPQRRGDRSVDLGRPRHRTRPPGARRPAVPRPGHRARPAVRRTPRRRRAAGCAGAAAPRGSRRPIAAGHHGADGNDQRAAPRRQRTQRTGSSDARAGRARRVQRVAAGAGSRLARPAAPAPTPAPRRSRSPPLTHRDCSDRQRHSPIR